MRTRITIAYSRPAPSRYDAANETRAVFSVMSSVAAVNQSLLELSYGVSFLPLLPPADEAEKELQSLKTDLVFNLFEGFCGFPETEVIVPELLEKMGIPFTGCDGPVLRLALDKAKMKAVLANASILTPDFQLLKPETLDQFHMNYPCIVKPASEDGSHGISEKSVVWNMASLATQIQLVSKTYGSAIVEEFLSGREFNATVMGNSQPTVLPIAEIDYSLLSHLPKILTFAAKWEPKSSYYQGTKVICPAKISAKEQKKIRETALAAYRLTGCRGYARVDMRMDKTGKLNVMEVNPNPDISPNAGATRQAKAAGMTYTQFIGKIVQLALDKEDNGHQNSPHAVSGQAGANENIKGHARIQTV